jgi:hypothetical protein
MSNSRRRQAPLTWEEWRLHAVMSALELLTASGCGESGSDGEGVHVHVLVTCQDPACPECADGAARTRLAAEDGPAAHPGCWACQRAAVG